MLASDGRGAFSYEGCFIYLSDSFISSSKFNSLKTDAINSRGIEWPLRAFASMRAVCLFLRARAFVKFLLRAASSLENTDDEQRAL